MLLVAKERFPEGELNEDFNLLVRLLPKVGAVAVLPEQDYHVFYRYGSNTRTRDEEEFPQVFTDIVKNADRVWEIVQEEYPQLCRKPCGLGFSSGWTICCTSPFPG